MRVIKAEEVHSYLDYESLIDRLEAAFRSGCVVPERQHYEIAHRGSAKAILMPAWREDEVFGIKTITVYPSNQAIGLPSLMATYLLLDGRTGEPLAVIDGTALTLRRTAAASALASRYLSKLDSTCHLMVGAGALAPHLIRAHTAVRSITQTLIWNRHPEKAKEVAKRLRKEGIAVEVIEDLEAAVKISDIITSATLSCAPLILGSWLNPGVHLDLVGAYTPAMRESDDEVIRRSSIYVDTRSGALKEAGDIIAPLERGIITESDVIGDLFQLTRNEAPARQSDGQITLFKSVGNALEDLAAAELAIERVKQ